jgi:hypothetical protein
MVSHLQRLVEDLRMLSLGNAGELMLHRQPILPVERLERVKLRTSTSQMSREFI